MSGSTRSANVPTKDEFDALAAKVDKNTADIASLNTRVTKLEQGTPPPTKVPSPDGTTVTSTTGSVIDSRLRTFKLIGTAPNYQIDCDGAVTGGSVVKLYAKGGLCYQGNAYGGWWVASKDGAVDSADDWISATDPTGTTPPPTGIAPPPQAVAAGYTNQVFFSDFLNANEVTKDRSGNTVAKWYATTDALNYTIKDSVLSLNNNPSSYNNCITTVANANAPRTAPDARAAGNGNGLRFQFGCYEAMLKFNVNNVNGPGWIAWWTSGFQHNVQGDNSKNSIELDFLEIFNPGGLGQSSTGLWNWASNPVTTVPTFATSGWGDVTYLVNQSTANAAADNFVDWVIVGAVITPNKCEVYWNSKARRARGVADTVIFRVDTRKMYNVNCSGTMRQAVYDASWLCDQQLMFGGASSSPLQVDYVAVWQ